MNTLGRLPINKNAHKNWAETVYGDASEPSRSGRSVERPMAPHSGGHKEWAERAYGGASDVVPPMVSSQCNGRLVNRPKLPSDIASLIKLLVRSKDSPLALYGVDDSEQQKKLALELADAATYHAHKTRVLNLGSDEEPEVDMVAMTRPKASAEACKFIVVTGLELIDRPEYQEASDQLTRMVNAPTLEYRHGHHVIGISASEPLIPFTDLIDLSAR